MRTIGILGGDLRQQYMADQLAGQGHTVYTYGMDGGILLSRCRTAKSLADIIGKSEIIIGPIPLSQNGDTIHTIGSCPEDFTLAGLEQQLKASVSRHPRFLAGMIPDAFREALTCMGISQYDFMKDDTIASANAVATAEGAVAKAIEMSVGTIQNSRSLIIGYGKCGKVLAQTVRALHSRVTVCARKENVRAEAAAYGFSVIDFDRLTRQIANFDYIYNTVPSPVLTRERLLGVSRDAAIIDIASAPGGLDYPWAKELCLNVVLYPGIPGKIAPKASAAILVDAIRRVL